MYTKDELKNMLVLDVETVSTTKTLDTLSDHLGENANSHWSNRASFIRMERQEYNKMNDSELYINRAALYPEFGKIIVISIGQASFENDTLTTSKIKSFSGDNEREVLEGFMNLLKGAFRVNSNLQLVGHNIKNFDMPYIIKRALINGVDIPRQLHIHKLKPWETCLLDTKDIWKFGGYSQTSLSLISDLLGLPSPKNDISGPDVRRVYYEENDLERIKIYCEHDVKATINILLKLANIPTIK